MAFYYPLPELKQSPIVYDCEKCGRCDNPKIDTPYFPTVTGNNYNGLVILGQQPTKEDDIKSIPFSNKKAQLLRSTAWKDGINLKNHGAFTWALQCHSGKKASDIEYKCCRSRMAEELIALRPKMILCCGEMAFKSLFDLKNKIAPTKLRGRLIPNFEFNCLVYTLDNPNDVFTYDRQYAFKKDVKRALKFFAKYNTYQKVDEFLKSRKILEGITIHEIKDRKDLIDSLKRIGQLRKVAVDFETTNVKPYDHFFEITHIQFGTASYAWVINESLWNNDPECWDIINRFMFTILTNPDVEKIIQNAKFEENCSRWYFDIKKIYNANDPMIATHVIDERRGCTSLDFQNLTRFGIPPYSDTVKSYLQKRNKDDKVNRIRQAPYEDMITYAGLDVITTYNNWELIRKIMPLAYPNCEYNYKFLLQGHQVFSNMTKRGIKIGEQELENLEQQLTDKMQDVLHQIAELPEFIQYNNYLKDKTNLKQSTSKELKTLTVKMKGDVTNVQSTDKKSNKPIRRKLSF